MAQETVKMIQAAQTLSIPADKSTNKSTNKSTDKFVSTHKSVLDLAVVIVSYNTVDLLRACLHSVMNSDAKIAYAVCVVDNASTDGSADMVRTEFPQVQLIAHNKNVGYSAANNMGLRWFGFQQSKKPNIDTLPRYALLLNPDTVVPPKAFAEMIAFMDNHPLAGVAGPCVLRPDGSLDKACKRTFPSPKVSLYHMTGLGKLFPNSRTFNSYNLEYLPDTAVESVDSVVGAYMQLRREAIEEVGLLDEAFFMYGEDLDWAKRIKDAGWEVWYNGKTQITHVKEAASSQSVKSRIDFYEAMWIFYCKHYRSNTSWLPNKFIMLGIVVKGAADVATHFWQFCRQYRLKSG